MVLLLGVVLHFAYHGSDVALQGRGSSGFTTSEGGTSGCHDGGGGTEGGIGNSTSVHCSRLGGIGDSASVDRHGSGCCLVAGEGVDGGVQIGLGVHGCCVNNEMQAAKPAHQLIVPTL